MAKRPTRRPTRRRPRQARTLAAPAPTLGTALRAICDALAALDVDFALVGGLAVSSRSEPRLTRDVDLAVDVPDDAAAEALMRDLLARGYKLSSTVEQSRTGRLATTRLSSPGRTSLVIDLLFASCGIESEIVANAEPLEVLPGLTVKVATVPHLIAMKILARDDRERPQDLDDIRNLLPLLRARDAATVTAALRAIDRRGFARKRDLLAAWRALRPRR